MSVGQRRASWILCDVWSRRLRRVTEPGKAGSGIRVSLAAVAAAVSTFLITIIAARALTKSADASAYSEFIVFWSLLSGCFGLVTGVQQESTRAARTGSLAGHDPGSRLLVVALSLGVLVAVVVLATGPFWGPYLLHLSPVSGVWAIAVGAFLYSGYAVGVGASGGLQDWGAYSGLMAIDSVARLALVAIVAAIGGGVGFIGWACATATLVTWAAMASPRFRRALESRGDRGLWRSMRATMYAMVSSAAMVTLVSGYPAVVSLVRRNANPAELASVMTVVQLARSPIMIPLMAFQGVAVTAFVAQAKSRFRPLLKPVALVVAAGMVGAPLAAWLGPFLLRTLYGPAYSVEPTVFASLVLASVTMALLTLTGTMTLALGRHRAYALGWLIALGVAVLILGLPGSLAGAVSWSLGLGPLCGIAVHAVAMATASRSQEDSRNG